MKILTILLMLMTPLAGCNCHPSPCPPYPTMPDSVKKVLYDNITPETVTWGNDQLRLKQKLEACRGGKN